MATIDAAIKGFIVHDRESGGLFAYGQWTRCAPRDPGDAGLTQTRPRGESIIALSDIAANGDIEGTLGELQNILPSAIVAAALPSLALALFFWKGDDAISPEFREWLGQKLSGVTGGCKLAAFCRGIEPTRLSCAV